MKLSFPEAEVTRSLSSSLYKQSYTSINEDDKRVIDTNALVAQRIAELSARMKQNQEQGGFVAGIRAETVEELTANEDVDLLTADGEAEIVDTEVLVARAMEQANLLQEDAKAQAERILAEATRQAEAEKTQIMEVARTQGYEQGMKQAKQELEKEKQKLQAKEKELEEQYQAMLAEVEPNLVDVIAGVYEHIFKVELSSQKEIVTHLIANALSQIEGGRSFLIHVSREDYPYVSMQKKQVASMVTTPGSSVEIVEDMTLSAGECLIETDSGIFDCGLGTQLEELGQKLRLLSYEKK